jgi:hypothetical protein
MLWADVPWILVQTVELYMLMVAIEVHYMLTCFYVHATC